MTGPFLGALLMILRPDRALSRFPDLFLGNRPGPRNGFDIGHDLDAAPKEGPPKITDPIDPVMRINAVTGEESAIPRDATARGKGAATMIRTMFGNSALPSFKPDPDDKRGRWQNPLGRRAIIAALGGGVLVPFSALGGGQWGWMGQARADAIPPADRIPFTVFRGGSEIGRHIMTFTHNGDDLTVDVEIELSVSVAFITAYSYSHRNREIWSGGRLMSLESTTDDDGDSFSVQARAENGAIQVDSTSGSYSAPADAIPSSYWNRNFLDRDRIINTQDGRFMEVVIENSREETIEAAGRQIAATRYGIGGLAPLTIWYSGAGQWVKLAFDGQGSEVSYELVAGTGASTLADG